MCRQCRLRKSHGSMRSALRLGLHRGAKTCRPVPGRVLLPPRRPWSGHQFIHQLPIQGAPSLDPFGEGAEIIGPVAAHAALIHHPREAAGAGQHGHQGHFRPGHGGRAVIGQRDMIGGQGQFIAAARRRAINKTQIFLVRAGRLVLNTVAGLVGEFAEIDLPGMA